MDDVAEFWSGLSAANLRLNYVLHYKTYSLSWCLIGAESLNQKIRLIRYTW